MRKMMKAIAAVLAVSALTAGSAFAADKLVVMGTDGTTKKVVVTDSGQITFNSTSTGKTPSLVNAEGPLLNFGLLSLYGDTSVPNAGASLQVVPKGTGYNANIKTQLSVFATDYNADPVNYEFLVLRAGSTKYSINASTGGTGLPKPITFEMLNYPKVVYATNGYVGINPTLSGTNVSVMPTHHLEVGNAAAGPGSGTVAIYPVTQSAASAGSASALPTAPAGYFTITINGVDRLVAYY
ncbi:hypothetical protein KI809_03760 [Geobacter pelophilus]|uniref:Uncharacterized protein n=1 Tax=Geoanaerobacter pelophilus TaxID=60036 RepID=A0AAW4KXF2_9BACT|nr:hypothetical protein [Geoanaerobacter pelophilus]MBT0663409.1 hypothetical protein [Geoanaerobacter pelophilus]